LFRLGFYRNTGSARTSSETYNSYSTVFRVYETGWFETAIIVTALLQLTE